MKTLKFTPQLCALIIAGEKTSTWRLFDDKDLQQGDELVFINKVTGESFGTAIIDTCIVKTLGTLDDADWTGHERFESEEAMYAAYRTYYGDRVTPDTEVKLLSFTFTPEN